jgi:hypothetical protein
MEYLYRISITYSAWFQGKKSKKPMYVVAKSKEAAKEYAQSHMQKEMTVKSVSLCGRRLGMNMYFGGEDAI